MRLIDADTFIEYLGLDEENAREDNLGEIVTLEDFDRQKTAYDVDKVIEKIREIPHGAILNVELEEEILEIVKSGGGSENKK